jgi:HK97 family phage major capsid protein
VVIERGAPREDGGVPLILSTDAKVADNTGVGVLEHTPEAIDMSIATRGLPLMVDHTRTSKNQVGLVRDVHLRADRTLAGVAYFSNSRAGKLYRQDVLDGIRPYVSVGAQVVRAAKEVDGSYRALRWAPVHVAIVDVPADLNTGFLRAMAESAVVPEVVERTDDHTAVRPEEVAVADEKSPAPAEPVVRDTGADVRREMQEIAALAAKVGMSDQVSGWVGRGLNVRDVQGEIIERQVAAAKAAAPTPVYDAMTAREKERYSVARAARSAISGDWKDAGLEAEVTRALAAQNPGKGDGVHSFMVPMGAFQVERALLQGTNSLGGTTVFTQEGEFIDILRNKSVIAMAGANIMTGITGGPITYPRQITAGAAGWRAENPGSDLAESNSTFDSVTLSPKLIQRTQAFSRQFMMQTGIDVEAFVRSDLGAVLALALDTAAINGGGSNEPVGIIGNTAVSTVTIGAQGGTIALSHLVSLKQNVLEANADQTGGFALVTNPLQWARAAQVQYFSGTNGVALWDGFDAPKYVSNQVPKNLTKGTQTTVCSAWLGGVFPNLMVPIWGQSAEFIVDPYSLKKQALIEITGYLFGDVNFRYTGAFSKVADAL